jgi:transcriptional regulator GlxA family with amidase domain
MSKTDEFRKQAKEAGEQASKSKSLEKAAIQRRRQKKLIQLADNEDWLDGRKTRPRRFEGVSHRMDMETRTLERAFQTRRVGQMFDNRRHTESTLRRRLFVN